MLDFLTSPKMLFYYAIGMMIFALYHFWKLDHDD